MIFNIYLFHYNYIIILAIIYSMTIKIKDSIANFSNDTIMININF